MKLKPGVDVSRLDPHLVVVVGVVAELAERHKLGPTVITSGRDGKHSTRSYHYKGRALDFRTRHLSKAKREKLAAFVRAELGEEYDVVLEATHLHVEWDP